MGGDVKRCRYIVAILLFCATAQAASLEWPQFGGPHRDFTSEELAEIERDAVEGDIDLWAPSSTA